MTPAQLDSGKPYSFPVLYTKPGFRRLKDGNIFTVTLEVEQATFDEFLAANPANSYVVLIQKLDGATMEPEVKVEKPEVKIKGEYGYIAQEIFASSWYQNPAIKLALGCLGEELSAERAKALLKASLAHFLGLDAFAFSLTSVPPCDWEAWAEEYGCLDAIKQMLRQAQTRKER